MQFYAYNMRIISVFTFGGIEMFCVVSQELYLNILFHMWQDIVSYNLMIVLNLPTQLMFIYVFPLASN